MKPSVPLPVCYQSDSNLPIVAYADFDTPAAREKLQRLTRRGALTGKIVLLPAFHWKSKLETPSSSVVAREQGFSLACSSPSPNCGMALLATPFRKTDLSPAWIDQFMFRLQARFPLHATAPVLTQDEVLAALQAGAGWALRKFNLPDTLTDFIENAGDQFGAHPPTRAGLEQAIPAEILRIARYRFARLGGGNHFIEIQTVAEILEPQTARTWGLEPDQIVVLYHSGSDVVGAYLGRLYAFRLKTALPMQFSFWLKKFKYLICRPPWSSFFERFYLYGWPGYFRNYSPDTFEGQRVLTAIQAAANFGFANRIAIFHGINQICRELMHEPNFCAQMVWDSVHNSIYAEKFDDQWLWVHRHNACRAYPRSQCRAHPHFHHTGQPVLLPGTNRTASFLGVAGEGLKQTYYSIDHGLGSIQVQAEKAATVTDHTASVRLYEFGQMSPQILPLYPTSVYDPVWDLYQQADLVRPVARLTPLATLKPPKNRML
ncbi:RtcB family protein [candidate division KSB1 bacterium]|nr:RtcB family protein [candidate division KSB1 bacterium]